MISSLTNVTVCALLKTEILVSAFKFIFFGVRLHQCALANTIMLFTRGDRYKSKNKPVHDREAVGFLGLKDIETDEDCNFLSVIEA